MAVLTGATWDPAGATPGGHMDPRVVIFHVTAVDGKARPHSGLEWHFHVAKTGQIDQLVDTNRQAAANYKANPFAISIETEGLATGEWTGPQLDSLVEISEWCMAEHPKILRQRCPTWDGSGFGYHVMFGAPGPWTPYAKSCPGPLRIRQFDEVLLPRILKEDDILSALTPEEQRHILAFVDKHWDLREEVVGRLDGTGALDDVGTKSGVLPLLNRMLGPVELTSAAVASLFALAVQADPAAVQAIADIDLDAVAKAVADEQDRRSLERLSS